MLKIVGFDISFVSEKERKKNILVLFSLLSLISVFVVAVIYLIAGEKRVVGILAAYIVFSVFNLWFVLVKRKVYLSADFSVLSFFALLVAISYAVSKDYLVFWYFIFPLYAIMLLGNRKGTAYSLIFLITVDILSSTALINFPIHLDFNEEIRFVAVYIIILLLVNFFEYTRNKAVTNLQEIYEKAKEKEKKFEELYHEIKVQNEELKATEEVLNSNNLELKKLNRKLEQKEYWLRNIIEHHGEGFAVTDWKETFIFSNPAANELFGVEENGLLGRNLKDFIDTEQLEMVRQFTRQRKKGKKNTYELVITRPDGTKRNILVTGAPFVWKEKKVLGTVGVFRDITERKKQEIELRESRKWLHTILEAIPTAIIMIDLADMKVKFVNSYTEKLLGYTKEEFYGRNCYEIICSREAPNELCVRDLNNSVSFEGYAVTKAGERIPVYRTISKIFYEGSNYLISSFVDISRLKKVEYLLKEKNQQFKNTIDNLIDVYIRADLQGNILQASPSAVDELKVPSLNDLVGHNLEEFFTITREKKFYFYSRLLKNGQIQNFRFSYVRSSDGAKRFLEVNATLFYNRHSEPAGFEAIVRDITSIILFEHKLGALNKKLKKAIKRLKRQKDLLEATHRSIVESMEYAKLIQKGLMPDKYLLDYLFDEYFVLFMPKATVGGDFYFAKQLGDKVLVAVADSTGHGVPGGFLSMIGISFLNEALNEASVESPSEVLEYMRLKVKALFGNYNAVDAQKNGMELALCEIDRKNNKLTYAGANLPLYIIRDGQIRVIKPTKNPIGFHLVEEEFSQTEIELKDNDIIYLCTDGYSDQFGLKKGKFKRANFKKMLLSIHNKPLAEQKLILWETILEWREGIEQTDDITIMGIRYRIRRENQNDDSISAM